MASSCSYLLIITCLIFPISIKSEENVCLWGRWNTTYEELRINEEPQINGLFRRIDHNVNGKEYYKQDNAGLNCTFDAYYIFWWNNRTMANISHPIGWYISSSTSFDLSSGTYILVITRQKLLCVLSHIIVLFTSIYK